MKRILPFLISLILLSSFLTASAEETLPAFTFLLDGIETPITLSTTPEEAVALLGEHTQFREEALEPIGSFFTIVNDSGLRFAGTECMRVVLSYFNDELLMLSCYITADALPDARLLIDEMNLRYGEGIENLRPDGEFFFISPPADWTWSFGESIRIEYYYDAKNSAFAHMLGFENLPIVQKMEDAYNAMFSSAQMQHAADS